MTTRYKISPTKFAKASFERDKAKGVIKDFVTWDILDAETKEEYLWEANYYLKRNMDEWPSDLNVF